MAENKDKEPVASEVVNSAVKTPTVDDETIGQQTQNYIEAYHATAEWIRFADAKAAVILTVGGAMGGLLIPTVHRTVAPDVEEAAHLIPNWQIVVVVLFVLYIVFLLLSGVFAFLCINPLRQKGKHPALEHCDHFHPAAISAKYKADQVKAFMDNCRANGHSGLLEEVHAALLFDSHISTAKYNRVKSSLRMFTVSVFFGFVYFLVLQF